MEGAFIAEKIKAAADSWEWTFLLRSVQLPTTTIKPRSSLFAERIMEEPLGAQDDGFGGTQETGFQIVDGKKWPPMDTCRDIVRAIGRAWSEKDPWANDPRSRSSGRFAPERISDAFNITVELAETMVARWLRTDVLTIDMVDNRTKRKGLKVKNGL